MSKLTIKQLEEFEPNKIFATGFVESDNVPGLGLFKNRELRWVAVRGQIADFAVYISSAFDSIKRCAKFGDKIFNKQTIQTLILMEENVFDRYRD